MAERRMFAKTIIDSDAFLEMPATSQMLYFHLAMRADDDGFINNPKRIMRMVGASEDDMRILIGKRFILVFDSGVIVIKHWKIHNYIQKDRYHPTIYKAEKAQISEKENGSYTECIQNGYNLDTQVRIGKDSLGKSSQVKDSKGEYNTLKSVNNNAPIRHKYGAYKNVLLTDDDYSKLVSEFPSDHHERIENLSEYMASTGKSYKNHLATIRSWSRKEKTENTVKKPTKVNYEQRNTDYDALIAKAKK